MGPGSIRTAPASYRPRRSPAAVLRLPAFAAVLLLAAMSISLAAQQQAPNAPPHTSPLFLPAGTPVPNANDRMVMNAQRLQRASFEAANAERKRQLDSDSAQLLKLAAELKAEIDRTPQDTLSLSIVRKAEEIERLAHSVQIKMKLTVGAD